MSGWGDGVRWCIFRLDPGDWIAWPPMFIKDRPLPGRFKSFEDARAAFAAGSES